MLKVFELNLEEDKMNKRVAVTGYGAVCSLGKNTEEIWDSILAKKIGYTYWEHPDKSVKAKYFGRIKFPLELQMFSKKILKNMPRFAKLGLMASREAINMAFGSSQATVVSEYYEPKDCGVIFGTGWGGIDETIENNDLYVNTGFASTLSNLFAMPSIGTASIALNWNLRGYQNTPSAACATGSISIGDAYERIKMGKAKMMLAGGGESILGNYGIWTVDILGALSKEQVEPKNACCPFSAGRTGFILSEGAGVICLEEYESAKSRGANILAEITGFASFTDAYDMTAPAPDLAGRVWAIKDAISDAQIMNDDVDYINAHGTSTQLNDLNETLALKEVFSEKIYNIPVSSTKSYTGHLIAATGAIETIFCIKSIESSIIPATINFHEKDINCDLNYVPNEHMRKKVKRTLNINYGFGGSNSCLVIQKVDE